MNRKAARVVHVSVHICRITHVYYAGFGQSLPCLANRNALLAVPPLLLAREREGWEMTLLRCPAVYFLYCALE